MTLSKIALHPRNVHFDWTGLPMRWIPGEALASHLLNVLHLLLPEGERFFVKVFAEALPLITDAELREDVLGFIGQEGMHATAHQGAQDYLKSQGLDASDYVAEIETIFRVILGDRGLSGARSEQWLIERLAFVAAIEHVTAFLGDWILNSPALDAARADPRMLDLLRWHGAEEVEHRAVAYDLFKHVDGRYSRRVRTYVVSTFVLSWLWVRGVRFLITHDPELPRGTKARWRDYAHAARRGIAPSPGHLLRSVARYVRPGYHPSQEGSTSQAVAYLASSPAALAADA